MGLDWKVFQNTINGKQETTQQKRHGVNPATGENGPEVPVSTKEEVDRAMKAAADAFESWSEVPWEERKKAVLAYADGLEAEKENFAQELTKEQGKPLAFARAEVDAALHWIRTVATLELPEETVTEGDKEIVVRFTPLGVTVGIVPWNFPIQLAVGKIAPSVLTGNPIIVKPSPFTPACGLKLAELAQQYFPPGVVQGLSGGDDLGPMLTSHPTPAKISFTGSTFTGKKVMESASKTLKRVTLELGGNDPAVILDDVNIDEIAQKVAGLAFLNSGQICIALKRIFVQESIADKFLEAMVKATKNFKVGPGTEPDVYLGPIQNKMQYERVKGFFTDIEKENWKVAVGGKNPDGPGYFITPTIIDRPDENSRIVTEEPFGPIVPFLTFNTDADGIKKANDTSMGLGASVWSSDLERAAKVARKIRAGNVWVNAHLELDPRFPFSGHKESGIGSEWGITGLKAYCNTQTLYLKRKE
ncbi:aldehyde dehydrogenase-like protein [Aaosphaeria arxii CBS 175.79]|uniref:aldehyde dehydrogenase (NAD(+)) n=1 Tax=Aaosphaeria arxii CBS 175.79 TaxID=1450172 RepID=A0A6A5XMV8_9PLEO|nr:aldehyde dehydrogenase-like protein [Aaosphaeria arxii CBS 175.79]KAF2014246.1 aldehyde dehydrogenase-like protein [Aaosphaeria arxii CBS 175.79]